MHELDAPCDILVDDLGPLRRSLRVAVVTETYPPEVNGVSLTVARVVQGLHERNHAVQLIRPRQAEGEAAAATPVDEMLTRGLPIPRYPSLRMGVPSKRALVQRWSHQRPDVVHVATEGPLGWSALQAALHLRLPVSSDFRTNFHAYSKHYGIGWLDRPIMAYLRKFHNRAHATMVPTEALRRELSERGFQRLHVVARGVDAERFHPTRRNEALRARWGAAPEDLVLLCVGRLAPEKNLGVALAAYEAIRRHHARARLVFVGEGPSQGELRQRCPQALFAGTQRGERLAEHYASADLFLFPSLTETYGNVTGEAMASGLPVVAYDYAAAAQLMADGESGMRLPCGNTPGFVAAALELTLDGARRQRMGRNARARAEMLGWDEVVGRVERILTDVAASADLSRRPGSLPVSMHAAPTP